MLHLILQIEAICWFTHNIDNPNIVKINIKVNIKHRIRKYSYPNAKHIYVNMAGLNHK